MISLMFDAADLIEQLGELQQASQDVLRPVAQAGAQVLYDEVKARAPVAKKPIKRKGKTIMPGALKRSIYQAFSKDNSGRDRVEFHVSWNARKAPHGHLVEFGTVRAPAHPFLRPAYDAQVGAAMQAAEQQWQQEMGKRIVKAGL